METDPKPKTLGDRLQGLSRQTIYLVLMIVVSLSVLASKLKDITLPNKPDPEAQDFYATIMSIPEGSTVLVQSDYTNSTRGESASQFEALLRILMRRNIKFALYCASGEPQAPQVARDVVLKMNEERKANGERPYEQWNDWVYLGLFTDGRATAQSMMADLARAFDGKSDDAPGRGQQPVMESPVLKNIRKIDDIALYIVITASKTTDILVERLKFKPVTYGSMQINSKLGAMVTGVMGPEAVNYYKSKQLFGLVVGLNGAVSIETLMKNGMKSHGTDIPGFPGKKNLARGNSYYFALHTAMGLLILLVVIGNVGMYMNKRANAAQGGR